MQFLLFLAFLVTVAAKTDPPSVSESKALVKTLETMTIDTETATDLSESGAISKKKAKTVDLLKSKKADFIKAFDAFDALDETDSVDGPDGFDAKDGANIASAVASGVINGFPDLVRGFKAGDWYYLTVGTLSILTSLTTVFGGPYGAMVGSILSIITSLLKTFGAPKIESQEGMIQRLLTDMTVDNLKMEVDGVEVYYRLVDNTVRHFRANPEKLTVRVALQLHGQAYQHTEIFGKIKSKTQKFCFTGHVGKDNREEKDRDVKRCLSLIKGYVKLTAFHQLLIADTAGLLKEAAEKSKTDKEAFNDLSEVFLVLLKELQALDRELLQFLASPMNEEQARYTIFNLYSNPGSNDLVIQYIRRLNPADEENRNKLQSMFDLDHVMFCSKEKLQGSCQNIRKGQKESDKIELSDWPGTKSFFVPPGLKVCGHDPAGPFYGLAVYSSSNAVEKMKEIQIRNTPIDLDMKMIRACTVDDWCDFFEEVSTQSLLKENVYHGIAMDELKSIAVPSNLKAMLWNKKFMTGPIYGKMEIDDLSSQEWDSIQISKTDKSAADFVTVCEENKFEGFCQQLDNRYVSDKPVSFSNQEDKINGEKKVLQAVSQVASMKIPAGFAVYLYTSVSFPSSIIGREPVKLGPYLGPLEIDELNEQHIGLVRLKKIKADQKAKKRFLKSHHKKTM